MSEAQETPGSIQTRLSWHNICIVLSLCLGSISYGYDFSIITYTIGQPAWYRYFSLTSQPTDAALYEYSNNIVGACLGLFAAGAVFGAVLVGYMCDKHGRKPCLVVAAVINIVGGAIQAGSVHIGMFLVGRFVTGFGAAMFVTLVPIYIAEVAPPAIRGLLVGQHGAFFLFGYSLASWVSVGSFYNRPQPEFQWRFPLALQSLWPMLLLIFVWRIPESPRWLMSRGDTTTAWKVLSRLHFDPNNNDKSESFARSEFDQIQRQLLLDASVYGDASVVDLFRKPHFAKRMLCAAIVMFSSQACGNLVIFGNSTILFSGLGFDSGLSLILSAAYITWACVCNFTNAAFLDRLGRIRSLVIGFSTGGVMVAIEAALVAKYSGTSNHAGLSAGVAMLFGYITTFAGFCDTTLYVYCSEIFPTHIRAKGMSWSIAVFMLSTLPFQESSTIGFANLGWRYYIIFIVFAVVCSIALYFVCPETKGLSLEEINELFGDKVAFHLTDASARVADGNEDAVILGTEEKVADDEVSTPKKTP